MSNEGKAPKASTTARARKVAAQTEIPSVLSSSKHCPSSSCPEEEGRPFDKLRAGGPGKEAALSTNGAEAKDGGQRDTRGRFLPRAGVLATVKRRVRKAKPTRWSAKVETAFLEALSQTGNVTHAARTARVSDSSVYRQRIRSAAFRTRWEEALREGYAKLQAEMLARALEGVEKPVFHGGKQIGTVREFDNRTALTLLRLHGATIHGAPAAVSRLSDDELRALVAGRLSEANKRMGGAG